MVTVSWSKGVMRRRSGVFLVAVWALVCTGVVVGAMALSVPPRAHAIGDPLLSECWRSTGGGAGFTTERAVTLGPTEEQKRLLGNDWLPERVVPSGGLLVDNAFFHTKSGLLVNKNKDNRMASEVKAEWGAESEPDAVLDQLKVSRYEAGQNVQASLGVHTRTQAGADGLDQNFEGSATHDTVLRNYDYRQTCGQNGCNTTESDVDTTAQLTYSYDGVSIKTVHPDEASVPDKYKTEKGGSYTVTEIDPVDGHADVAFTAKVDELEGDGNARLEMVTADRAVNTAGDVVRVTIDLSARHRKDVEHDGRVWPLFGDSRVGSVSGLWPKQSFLWDDGANSNSSFGLGQNGGVVLYTPGTPGRPALPAQGGNPARAAVPATSGTFTVNPGAQGLLTGGEIRWPVYLSDMAWYLYRVPHVPQEYYRARNANELYNVLAGDVNPNLVFDVAGGGSSVIWPETDVTWSAAPDRDAPGGNHSELDLVFSGDVVMPFVGDGAWPPSGAELVKAGVVSPEDGEVDVSNVGMNTFFQFDIVEHQAHGELPRRGDAGLGIGPQGHHWWNLVNPEGAWPNGELDPGETHVLVVTFYEGQVGDGEKVTLASDEGERVGRLVTAKYRRIVCRVVVAPLGVGFGSDTESGFWRRAVGLLEKLVNGLLHLPAAMMNSVGLGAMGGMSGVVAAAERAGCGAVGQLDGRRDEGAVVASRDGGEGVSGEEDCAEATAARTVSDCIDGVPGSCREQFEPLVRVGPPTFRSVSGNEGVIPRLIDVFEFDNSVLHRDLDCSSFTGTGPDVCYGGLTPTLGTGSAHYVAGCPGGECDTTGGTRALPELRVTWSPVNGFADSDHDGYIVKVKLDDEAGDLGYYHDVLGNGEYYPLSTSLPGAGLERSFYLPRYLDQAGGGGVAVDIGAGGLTFGAGKSVELVEGTTNLSAPDGTDLYDLQKFAQERMVLGDGMHHEISVALYRGSFENDGENGLDAGPFSAPMVLDGNEKACEFLDLKTNKTATEISLWNALLCPESPALLTSLGAGGLSSVGGETLDRFQAFTGTEVCKDILTGTPAHLTYDLPAVRAGWKIAWIVSMALIPILLFWEALRMSWGVWLGENQISGAVRNLAPRLLLGIVLATGSLLLAQLLIMFCAQLTCYVGQATDVTLWGVIGWAFKGVFQSGFGAVAGVGGGVGGLLGALTLGISGGPLVLAAVGFGLLMVLVVVFAVVLLLVLQMTVRILVIGVLTMLAPVAFMMVLSPTTSGWAWRWMSMMIGTLFMQVVAVMVLFLGIEIAKSWGSWGEGLGGTVMSLLMSFVVFYVATKVPSVMNSALGSMMTGVVTEVRRSAQAGAMLRMASQASRFRPRTP